MTDNNLLKRIATSLVLILILLSMFISSKMMMLSIITVSIIALYEFSMLLFKILKKKILRYLFNFLAFLYLIIFVLIIFFVEFFQQFSYLPKLYFFYSILVSVCSDIGGFVVGKIFKGKKLTKLSPNKTISGAIGSFIFSLLLIPLFINIFVIIDLNFLIAITLIISLISQLGDIFISYLKRRANVKDTGKILPGHGGILDRIDGIVFAVPIGLLLFNLNFIF